MIISGDLVHLGTAAEFRLARKILEPLIQKGSVLLTAGNHDRYTPRALGLIEDSFGDCYPFNQAKPAVFSAPENWQVLELPMSRPSGFWAKGKMTADIEEYRSLILGCAGKPVLLYGHYPLFHPKDHREAFGHRLWQLKQVRTLTHLPGVKAYLHGHMHVNWAFQPEDNPELWEVNAGGTLRAGYWALELKEEDVCLSRHKLPL